MVILSASIEAELIDCLFKAAVSRSVWELSQMVSVIASWWGILDSSGLVFESKKLIPELQKLLITEKENKKYFETAA